MTESRRSLGAAAISALFGVIAAAMLFVPLWFIAGVVSVGLIGHLSRVQILVAAPFALAFGFWVARLAYGYFCRTASQPGPG